MQRVVMRDVDVAYFRDAIGTDCYARGAAAVRRNAVIQMHWDASRQTLTGTVRDRASGGDRNGGEIRTVSAQFRASAGFPLRFRAGSCSCVTGVNCEHVAALVVAATDESAPRPSGPPGRRSALPWEQSLNTLLAARHPAARPAAGQTPLAVELSVDMPRAQSANRYLNGYYPREADRTGGTDPREQPLLLARLVQPGQADRWIAGNLSWSRIDYLSVRGDYPAAHIRLLHELYAVYRAGNSHYYAYDQDHGYRDQKTIDLAAFESRQLWPILEEARAIGLPLVYPRNGGPVPPVATAELFLDVTADTDPAATGLLISPVFRADGEVVVPLRFIGSEAHGVVVADPVSAADLRGARFRLARLASPVPAPLRRQALAGEHLPIPDAGRAAFASRYYPRLARMATVISSDGAFTPHEIRDPALVLRADYCGGHGVTISWEWSYQAGEAVLRAPLEAGAADGDAGFRDPEAEARVLSALALPPGIGGIIDPERTRAWPVRFTGLDTMAFTTRALPLIAGLPGVSVETTGQPADYREADDSVRIGVSAGELDGEPDWFDLGITVTAGGREVPFAELFVALASGQSHMLLPDGAYFSLRKPEFATLARLIEEARALTDRPAGGLRISRFQAGLWEELADLGVVSHQARAWQRQVRGLLSADGLPQTEPPGALRTLLRPYQVDGFRWLAFLWEHRLGGILADDMGLGKTLQMLALISHAVLPRGAPPPFDPPAWGDYPSPQPPLGQVPQKPRNLPTGRPRPPGGAARPPEPPGGRSPETGDLPRPPFLIVAPTSVLPNWAAEAARFTPGLTVVTIGDTLARRGQRLSEVIAGADAVVTSYTLLRLDFGSYGAREWSGLIMDEAQYVKNHRSKAYACARQTRASFKIAITGTPMENNLMELWSLLSITAPGMFPDPERFREYYARPIEKDGNAELLAQLRRRIRPLVKRRTKEQVAADLPDKQEQVIEVDLDPRHRRLYQTHLQRERQKVLGLLEDVSHNRFTILRSLTLLRQLSLHAGLVDAAAADVPCAKVDALVEQVLDVAGSGHRALVFSQFTRFLRLVRSRLEEAGVAAAYLDGETANRAAVISEFKHGTAPVFLISLKAGGFGLNLTEADYVFLLDPWWNPATEAQAVDRVHRIGQTRHVMVYRLISSGTIEEKVMALKARKSELFSRVIDGDGAFSAALDAEDIRALLS